MTTFTYNGYSAEKTPQDYTINGDVYELWDSAVSFADPVERAMYFKRGGTAHCITVSVQDGEFIYTIDDTETTITPTQTIPSDEELQTLLNNYLNG